jgi:LacI family transcriptional regulator
MGGFAFEMGIQAGRELLTAAQRPTAIFAANDDLAAGVMAACNQLGLLCPKMFRSAALTTVGWRTTWPYLTTVYQPIEAMAETAALMLIDRKENDEGNNGSELGLS